MNDELKFFEEIKQVTDSGVEYWSARDLQRSLGYEKWENFSKVIDKAMLACDVAGFDMKKFWKIFSITVIGLAITIQSFITWVEVYHYNKKGKWMIEFHSETLEDYTPITRWYIKITGK